MKAWQRFAGIAASALAALALATSAQADGTVGKTFPAGFPVIEDASLAKPVIGFGAAGPVTRNPVVFLHGNNDTPFATACNPYGRIQALAQYLADNFHKVPVLMMRKPCSGRPCAWAVAPALPSQAHTTAPTSRQGESANEGAAQTGIA